MNKEENSLKASTELNMDELGVENRYRLWRASVLEVSSQLQIKESEVVKILEIMIDATASRAVREVFTWKELDTFIVKYNSNPLR